MTSFHSAGPLLLSAAVLALTLSPLACGGLIRGDGNPGDTDDSTDAGTTYGGGFSDGGTVYATSDGGSTWWSDGATQSSDDASTQNLDAGTSPGIDASVNLPPIDPTLPPPPQACAQGTGAAYVVAESGAFYAWDPTTVTATKLGTLSCPTGNPTYYPWDMTVTQTDAYVMYSDWNVYRVALDTLACTLTPYTPAQVNYPGDVAIATSPSNQLYVYGIHDETPDLAVGNLTDFTLSEVGPIGPLPPMAYPVDAKIDAYGRLFAADWTGNLVMIDPTSGHVQGFDNIGVASQDTGWALLTYNDGIYFFAGQNGGAYRWDLTAKKLTAVGAIGEVVVGAGSAPCAH